MPGNKFFIALALLILSLSAPALADSHLSADPQVNHARQLVKDKQYPEALQILRLQLPAQETAAHRVDVLFLIGLAAMRQAEQTEDEQQRALLDEAISALRGILISNPALLRVRLELARAFFLKREDELAKEHFELALAAQPPPSIATNIRLFLQAIRARKRWNGYFSMAIVPSSNINNGTYHTTAPHMPGLSGTFNEESREQSGVGMLFTAGGDYQFPLSERWRGRFGVDVRRTEFAGSEYDNTMLGLRGGVRILPSDEWETSAQLLAGTAWQTQRQDYNYYGLQLDGSRRLSDKWQVSASASWRNRRYRSRAELDGLYSDYRLGMAYFLTPVLRMDSRAGFYTARPQNKTSRNRQWFLRQSATLLLPRGWQVNASAQWGRTKYEETFFGIPDRSLRRDRRRIYRLGALNSRFTLGGFSPQLFIGREVQDSNFIVAEYKRISTELYFVRQF